MRHAAAGGASAERKTLVTPNVSVERTSAGHDPDLAPVVVTPEACVATADRTVAAGEVPWLAVDLNLHCSAVA